MDKPRIPQFAEGCDVCLRVIVWIILGFRLVALAAFHAEVDFELWIGFGVLSSEFLYRAWCAWYTGDSAVVGDATDAGCSGDGESNALLEEIIDSGDSAIGGVSAGASGEVTSSREITTTRPALILV